jgi:hypothetical protein
MKVNLFFNYYKCDRQADIDFCLKKNMKVFDNVFVIYGRPTFDYIFNRMREFPKDINVYCNSDIYFESVEELKTMGENKAYCLTRYNLKEDGSVEFFGRADSQDAWIFRGAPKEKLKCEHTTGKWGIDNSIAHLIKKAGYEVSNPSLSIRTIHVHPVDNRDHKRTKENTVPPPYLSLQPCKL